MRALKISVEEMFWDTLNLTWWKFNPRFTSTPIKRNSPFTVTINNTGIDDITMIDAAEPISIDSFQSN